ncbi:MAG: transglycosylase SLT domain-containing protein [Deltaproteobacteria bacterium]|nr:transglycosylase SLT domain-containing protein [Deltaproteobacteria bacterium]
MKIIKALFIGMLWISEALPHELVDYKIEEERDFINYADKVVNINISFNISSNDALFEEGYYFYKIEDYESALRKMEDYVVVSTNPELRDYALFIAGVSALYLKDYERAYRLFESIIYIPYLEDYKIYFLAYSSFKLGRYDILEKMLEVASKEYPSTILLFDIELLRLDMYIAQNRYRDIISQASMLLTKKDMSNDNPFLDEFLLFNLAKAYLAIGDNQNAKEVLLRIYVDYPLSVFSTDVYDILTKDLKLFLDVQTRVKRADELFSKQLFKNALEEYKRVEEIIKRGDYKSSFEIGKKIKLKMADCYANLKENNKARELYIELLEDSYYGADVKAYLLYRLAQLEKRRIDNSEAIRLYEELAEKYPRSKYADEARYLSIWLRYNDGKYEEAIARFKQFVSKYKRSPKRLDALWFLGINLYKYKKYDEAYRYFYEIKRIAPNTEREKPASIYFLGKLAFLLGKKDEAKEHFINLIENFPLNYYSLMAQNRLKEFYGEEVAFPEFETLYSLEADSLSISEEPERFILAQEGLLRINKALQLIRVGLERYAKRELNYINIKLNNDYKVLYFLASIKHKAGDYNGSMRILRGFFVEKMLYRPSMGEIRFWKKMFPLAYLDYVIQNAEKNQIDPLLILAIMREESHFRPTAVSPAGAKGLMQIMPRTGSLIAKSFDMEDFDVYMLDIPEINIQFGSWYLSQLLIKFNNQLPFAIAAYNAGPSAVDRWLKRNKDVDLDIFIEEIPYRETRNYVKRVLQTYGIYNFLYKSRDRKNVLPLGQKFESTSKDNINY